MPLLALSAATLAPCAHLQAQDTDAHWVLRLGAHVVDPQSGTGQLAGLRSSVDNSTRPSLSIEYLLTPHWGLEALAALPFSHQIDLDGQKAATTKQLPPVVGIDYHFMPRQVVSPFLGLGVKYTDFYDSKGGGRLAGQKVGLDNSVGLAAHAGVDIRLSERWLFTADLRRIAIHSEVRVDGAKVGDAHLDPWVYGVSAGYRF